MFKKYDHRRIVFGDGKLTSNNFGKVNKKTLVEFVQRYSLPFVVDFNYETADKAFSGWVDHHLLIFASRKNHSWDLINEEANAIAGTKAFYMKVIYKGGFCDYVSNVGFYRMIKINLVVLDLEFCDFNKLVLGYVPHH